MHIHGHNVSSDVIETFTWQRAFGPFCEFEGHKMKLKVVIS